MFSEVTPVIHQTRKIAFRVLTSLVIVILLLTVLFIALPSAHAGDIPGGSSPVVAPTPTP